MYTLKDRVNHMPKPHLHIAIPAMDELAFLPQTLDCIAQQVTHSPFTVYVCVNQPDEWWQDTEKIEICERNQQLINLLKGEYPFKIEVLDYSSCGCGWKGKNFGVGWARKRLFERIFYSSCDEEDILISLDADTTFESNYFESIAQNFQKHPMWHAIAVPYYHPLTNCDELDRAMLRYEIYMRNYAINLLHIGSPYSFTALGSAIAARVKSLKKIGGITPLKSGEDFYLLQKLRKMGMVGLWNETCVYPGTRYSHRVFFGTGPAMEKGNNGDWTSYPIYPHTLFQKIAETYQLIDELYLHDLDTPFLNFLQCQFKQHDLWQPLRDNAKDSSQFKRAFHEKADGLRILQFLKEEYKGEEIPEISILLENLSVFATKEKLQKLLPHLYPYKNHCLNVLTTSEMNEVRDFLFEEEMNYRKHVD